MAAAAGSLQPPLPLCVYVRLRCSYHHRQKVASSARMRPRTLPAWWLGAVAWLLALGWGGHLGTAAAYSLTDPTADHTDQGIQYDQVGKKDATSVCWLDLGCRLQAAQTEVALGGRLERVHRMRAADLYGLCTAANLTEPAARQLELWLRFHREAACPAAPPPRNAPPTKSPKVSHPPVPSSAPMSAAPPRAADTPGGTGAAGESEAVWRPLSIPMARWDTSGDSAALTSEAIADAQAGRLDRAIQNFAMAVSLSGDAAGFTNLATALTDYAMARLRGRPRASQTAALPLLKAANAAIDVALLLSPYSPHLLSELRRLKLVGASHFPTGCGQSGCGARFAADEVRRTGRAAVHIRRQERAVSAALRGALRRHWGKPDAMVAEAAGSSMRNLLLEQVGNLCTIPSLLRVTIPKPAGTRGRSSSGWNSAAMRPNWVAWLAAMRRAVTLLRICGAVVLNGVLPDRLTSMVHASLAPVREQLTEHAEQARGLRNASWEMLYNPITPGARRYHGRVPLRDPFDRPEVIWPSALRQVLTASFSGNRQLEIGRYSFVTAMPGCGDQNWHKVRCYPCILMFIHVCVARIDS
eukprot:COSAG01_NODE_3274_length_6319_cov_22.538585_6_plen_583_part_00